MDAKRMEIVGSRKAVVALTAALSCLLIYILACVFSPPSWSPDSSSIAILVTPPGEAPEHFAIFAYNVHTGKRTLLDEAEGDSVLSTPAWSPGGRWIAYYRVDPPVSQADESPIRADDPNKAAASPPAAEKPLGEQNRMLPAYVFDLLKQEVDADSETFDVKLIVVTPDGKEKKTLRAIQWAAWGSSDDAKILMLLGPQWSRDSKRLFYARSVEDVFYIGSLDLDTGELFAHMLSATGTPAVSPDGDWLASLDMAESEQAILSVARVDGAVQKYFRLGLEMESGDDPPYLTTRLSWSGDSKSVLVAASEGIRVVDVVAGKVREYRDPDAEATAFGVFSSRDNRFYYLAGHETDDSESDDQKVVLKSHDLRTGRTRTILKLFETPGVDDWGQFSVSPNGKVIALRCTVDGDEGQKSTLLLWDGKTRKTIQTHDWLHTPVR